MNRAVIWVWLMCHVVFSVAVPPPWNDDQRLLENLLDTPGRYDRRVRPVQNATQPVDVYVIVGQERIAILSLDSKKQDLFSAASFSVQWEDKRLSWNPDDYGGVEYILVETKDIWYPRLTVRNNEQRVGILGDSTDSLVMYNGTVNTMNLIRFNTNCFFKQKKFPFDGQSCFVLVGLSTTPESLVRLFASLTKKYEANIVDDWKLLNITLQPLKLNCANFEVDLSDTPSVDWVKSPLITDPRCLYTSDFTIMINLQRQWSLYLYSVIAPSTVLAVIAAAIFWLPPECGEKLSFGVAILLGFVVFQTLVQAAVPDGGSDKPPAMLSFIVNNFFLSAGSVLLTAVTLTLYHRESAQKKTVDVNHCSTITQENNVLRRDADALEDEKSKVTVADYNWKMIARRLDLLGFTFYVGGFFTNIIVLVVKATSDE